MFTPKVSVQISVSCYTMLMYPKVTANILDCKCPHAYHQMIAVLKVFNIDPDLFLDTLGSQLGFNMTVEGQKFDFINYYRKKWTNFAHLEILSFHNSDGMVVARATLGVNDPTLKSVADYLAADNRCPLNIKFVRVKHFLDFALVMAGIELNHVLKATNSIELPQ
jgi:hypothetical protein